MVSELDRLIESYHSPECEFNIDKSIEVCKEILRIDPTMIEFESNLACSYYNKKEYEKSIEIFNNYIGKGGELDISYFMIALSYHKLGDRENAFKYLEMIEDEMNYLLYHLRFHYETEDYEKAIPYGDQLLEIDPENHIALPIMSTIYEEIGDYDRSIFYFDEFANLFPQLKPLEIIKLYSLGKYEEAIEIFEDFKNEGIFDGDLENERFNSVIGNAYYELRKPYDALKYLIESDRLKADAKKKANIAQLYMNIYEFCYANRYLLDGLKMDPLNEICLFKICENCFYREEYLKSIEYANTLLSKHSNSKVFHILGAVYFELGEKEKALENISLGNRLMLNDDDFEEYILVIALRLSEAGQHKRALKIYDGLLEKFPKYDFLYMERARTYKRMGNEELAQRDFKKYNDARMKRRMEYEENIFDYHYL